MRMAKTARISDVMEALNEDGRVVVTGFGTFSVKTRRAHQGTDPRNGETITVPERRVVSFVPSRQLKARLND